MADIGSVLGGRYRLIELLGQGGMATIYRARDHQLERDVAVKLLRPEYGRDPDFLSRFRQEAQSAASLNHPNVVQVFDYGQDTAGPFIVMELIDGEDLAAVVRRTGALPPRQAARLTADIARALEAAHRQGIVHRDVKPHNVMLDREGRVKVTDFGIARAVAEAQMTLPGQTIGSVHYFSPEQARGEATTPASDVYSLGIVLYELLTGRRPWEGDSAAAVAMARLSGAVPSPSAIRGGIPAPLEAVARRALALDPGARYLSGGAMADALDDWLRQQGVAPSGAGAAAGAGIAAAGAAPTSAVTAPGAAGAAGLAGAGGFTAANTVASGVARPNPGRTAYPPDAYADAGDAWDADARSRRRYEDDRRYQDDRYDEEPTSGTSPWVWISALLALAILAVIGFLVVRLLTGGAPPVEQIAVPNLVGMQLDQAIRTGEDRGFEVKVERTEEREDVPEDEVLQQNPTEGQTVPRGGTVNVVTAVPPGSVTVPNLINEPVQEAIGLLVQAGLRPGEETEEYDPTVPAGNVIDQTPFKPGTQAPRGTVIDYVVSLGPEPTPSPTPSPTPAPTPTPPPPPTPTPEPTPTPTPELITVGDYRCLTVADAIAAIEADGFAAVVLPPESPAEWFVSAQNPSAGQQRSPGSEVVVTTQETLPPGC